MFDKLHSYRGKGWAWYDVFRNSGDATAPTQDTTRYKVVGVKDGDTFVVLMEGREQVVRFAHIDCPENKQPFGNNAKQFVSDLCFGTYVTLIHDNDYDRNKRLIAEVLLEDGRNLNKELVKNGLAWHFKRYSDSDEYAKLEAEARSRQIGVWSEPNPIAPWDWRKPKK
ncbi:MAG TPA: thermonuclease family protein [Sphingobacterium sp.]|nr:thermonuclease family protein [Sphingobacterium sp.]